MHVDVNIILMMDGDDATVVYTGARPGKAACSFPQGVAEIVLRTVVAVSNIQAAVQNYFN